MYCVEYGASFVNYNIKRTTNYFARKKNGTRPYLTHPDDPVILILELITKVKKRTFLFGFRDGKLSRAEFFHMVKYLFSRKGVPYKLTKKNEQELFKLLDENQVSISALQSVIAVPFVYK